MRLARTFAGVELVPFSGEDVYNQMLDAVADGSIDAMVDDDVVLVPLGDDPRYDVAFTVRTRNAWGIGVAKDNPDLRAEFDAALGAVIADGSLERAWNDWMPSLEFPLTVPRPEAVGDRA
jgi:polar amino acid transport system substrate-binding protein